MFSLLFCNGNCRLYDILKIYTPLCDELHRHACKPSLKSITWLHDSYSEREQNYKTLRPRMDKKIQKKENNLNTVDSVNYLWEHELNCVKLSNLTPSHLVCWSNLVLLQSWCRHIWNTHTEWLTGSNDSNWLWIEMTLNISFGMISPYSYLLACVLVKLKVVVLTLKTVYWYFLVTEVWHTSNMCFSSILTNAHAPERLQRLWFESPLFLSCLKPSLATKCPI